MENKYYTPEIEEFHVGFEFEAFDSSMFQNREWKKVTITNDSLRNIIINHDPYALEQIKDWARVKYLDREDIESLGFEYDGKSCLDETWEKEESIVDTWSYYVDTTEDKEKYYSLYSQGKLCYITYTAYQNSVGSTEEQIFKGTIKNKSELKRLLKQLNLV